MEHQLTPTILCVILLSFPLYTNSSLCTTTGCNATATLLRNNLDESTKPCDDFFQFACGGFIKNAEIKGYDTQYSYFLNTQKKVLKELEAILNTPASSQELATFGNLKAFHRLCMDLETLDKNGLDTPKLIIEKLGGWPALVGKNWDENRFDWKSFAHTSRNLGLSYNYIVGVAATINLLNTSEVVLAVLPPSFGLEAKYLLRGSTDSIVKAYYNFLVDLAVEFGSTKENARKEIEEALQFEIELAKIGVIIGTRNNISMYFDLMDLESLQKQFPNTPWKDFLNNLIDNSNHSLSLSSKVIVVHKSYLPKLETLLNSTSKRVQANYLMYRVLETLVRYMPQKVRNHKLSLLNLKFGINTYMPRLRECVALTTATFKFAAGALYVRKHFSEHTKKKAEILMSNLKAGFIKLLKQVEWMDGRTKTEAIEKAYAMQSLMGYPQELLENEKLEQYYSKLNATTMDYMEFALTINKFLVDKSFEKLITPFNKYHWDDTQFVGVVNAYYNYVKNSLQIPAAIIQSPFFDPDRPNYMNYGSLGYIIGHEISHGFDDVGRQYDKRGNLKDWWAKETREIFISKAICIVNQYSSYSAQEINKKLNGAHTVGENIADNAGIEVAYFAYKEWVKINGEEQGLSNLKYTPKQLFWISAANTWCSSMKPEALKQKILNGVHSPPRFRVIGPFSNSPWFARDFNCPLGSKMNPINKFMLEFANVPLLKISNST